MGLTVFIGSLPVEFALFMHRDGFPGNTVPGGGFAGPGQQWRHMFTPPSNPHPRDRHADLSALAGKLPTAPDRGVGADGLVKPAILRRSTIRFICIIWLALVAYGTLGPLGYGSGQWIVPVENWSWIPPTYPISYNSYNDIFTNVLVYIPVGIALALLLRRRGGVRGLALFLAMFLAVTLSYVTELLQQYMPARCYDRGDLVVNSVAALLGCLVAPRAQNAIRRGHEYAYDHWRSHPWLLLAWVMTAVTLALMTLPWDFYKPSIELEYYRDFDLLDFRRFAAFLLLGFLIAMAMIERHGPRPHALSEALKRVFVCGVFFEAAQIFLRSHACGLLDISTAFFGGLVGLGVAQWLTGMSLTKDGMPTAMRRWLATVALFGLVLFGLVMGMSDANMPQKDTHDLEVHWCPFQVQFLESFDRVIISAAETLFLCATITMLCLYLTRGRGRGVALLLLLGMIGVVEMVQALSLGGQADITPLLLAFAAWLLTVRCWNAFVPRTWRSVRDTSAEISSAVLEAQV